MISARKAKGARPFSHRGEQQILANHARTATRLCQVLPGLGGAFLVRNSLRDVQTPVLVTAQTQIAKDLSVQMCTK